MCALYARAAERISRTNPTSSKHQTVAGKWPRPNNALQPTPLRVERDRADFTCYHMLKAFPISDWRRG